VTDYKKYALGQVENFLYDAMSSGATPQEIYDVIKGVVEDNYYTYKKCTSEAYELLGLLNGNGKGHSEHYYDFDRNKPVVKTCDKDNTSEECKKSWYNFWENPNYDDTELMREYYSSVQPSETQRDIDNYSDEELNAMCDAATSAKKDKVNKWILPVDDDYNITFPEDLLEQTGWKEGDTLQWIDQGDGSFIMKKDLKVENESVHENDWNKDYEV
jgi:bifunctional DNA-binding transcriptional regulator/antitoxin component of YhaV-PrlF toxin-antitoxin module